MKTYYKHNIGFWLFLAISIFIIVSCEDDDSNPTQPTKNTIKIAVLSDLHFYDLALGTNSAALDTYLLKDRKLLRESNAIIQSAINSIIAQTPDVVVVCGDMTKDGEKTSHQKLIPYLQQFTNAGIKVVVVPGNHDINNPEAMSFLGSTPTPVSTISYAEFKSMYNNFGFSSAISSDANSLSYVCEPYPGVRFICIDPTKSANNTNTEIISGEIKAGTLSWIKEQLAAAKAAGKQVFGVMHHGMTEHYTGQTQFFGEYVIDNWQSVSADLAANGLNIIFTGHYHSHDITKTGSGSAWLYDIETGSMSSYPCPWRLAEYNSVDKTLSISSYKVTSINYNISPYTDFQLYAKDYFAEGTHFQLKMMLMYVMQLTEAYAEQYATAYSDSLSSALLAHWDGNEAPSLSTQQYLGACIGSSDPIVPILGNFMGTLWTDKAPLDKQIIIDLLTGNVK